MFLYLCVNSTNRYFNFLDLVRSLLLDFSAPFFLNHLQLLSLVVELARVWSLWSILSRLWSTLNILGLYCTAYNLVEVACFRTALNILNKLG